MQLLDVEAVATATGLRQHNIYHLTKRGMPHYRAGIRVRFSLPEVLGWMKAQAAERLERARKRPTLSVPQSNVGE